MTPRDQTRIRHMIAHAREAVELGRGRTRRDIDSDRVLCLALTRLIEVIGEAASKVSPEGRAAFPNVPWRAMIGMRNRLIHGYDTIDIEVLWQTLCQDLPDLLGRLEGGQAETER